jgi:hypothetical protein
MRNIEFDWSQDWIIVDEIIRMGNDQKTIIEAKYLIGGFLDLNENVWDIWKRRKSVDETMSM